MGMDIRYIIGLSMGLKVVGMAVGLVMGLVIVYCMGSVYSKVALCE